MGGHEYDLTDITREELVSYITTYALQQNVGFEESTFIAHFSRELLKKFTRNKLTEPKES